MSVHIPDANFPAWLMHDARLFAIQTTWTDDGEMSLFLPCTISDDEKLIPLYLSGITTCAIMIELRDVWHSDIQLIGGHASRPVIDRWIIEPPATLICALPGPPVEGLLHHRITMMSGSKIDVLFDALWIEER